MSGDAAIELDLSRSTERAANTTLLGSCYWRVGEERDQPPLQALADVDTAVECRDVLDALTGFFAAITDTEDGWVVAADAIQGIPLYYTVGDDRVLVTDSQQRALQSIGEREYDPVSVAEYRTVTYVTGSYTLVEGVRQVEPGTFVTVADGSVDVHRYFQYEFRDQRTIDRSDLDDIVDVIVTRVVEYADGRPIWIPLSAGYDSRLLATVLAERGYDDLHTFSYGQAGNYESTKSRGVAASLGLPWEFVEYTHEKWRELYLSDDRESFDAQVELITVPPLREWAAVRELRDSGIVSADSVIVPGHSADFLAGSHIPTEWYGRNHVSRSELVDRILDDHYHYNEFDPDEREAVGRRVEELAAFSGGSGFEAIEAYERWDWQARQVRQITAHVWPHEHLGLDWWMPFWDRDFFDFWLEVNLEQRLDRRFYNDYVWHRYQRAADDPVLPEGFPDTRYGRTQYWIKRSPLGPLATRIYNALLEDDDGEVSAEEAFDHAMANTGMMEFETFEELYNGDLNARSYRARERLGEVEF